MLVVKGLVTGMEVVEGAVVITGRSGLVTGCAEADVDVMELPLRARDIAAALDAADAEDVDALDAETDLAAA